MDRLLRAAFAGLIRTGTLRVTSARGSTFTLGDGSGRPAAIRFTTPAAERAVLLDPSLRFGEAYADGGIVVEQGSIADVRDPARSARRRPPSAVVAIARRPPLSLAPHQAIQSAPARGATSRTTTISTASSTRCSSTATGNTAAPISRPPTSRSMTPSSRRSATSPAKLLMSPDRRVLDVGCGAGRARALSGRALRRPHRHHPFGASARARARAGRRERAVRQGRISSAGLP